MKFVLQRCDSNAWLGEFIVFCTNHSIYQLFVIAIYIQRMDTIVESTGSCKNI